MLTPSFNQAHPVLGDRWSRFIQRLLPWFDPNREARRNAETERIRQKSIRMRIIAEQRLASYQNVRLRR